MKKVAILGSTGSIGTQTLDVISRQDDLKVVALSAGKNITRLEQQIRQFKPEIAAVWEEEDAKRLRLAVADLQVKIVSGMEGLIMISEWESSDILVTAIVGMIGIRPTIAAIQAGKDIALANKETLVTAGHIIIPMIQEYGVSLLPVDSEHSAIFQCLDKDKRNDISRIWLTASGGPFLGRTRKELESVTLSDALKHPNWSMGKKITVDSATLVNKGLEIMEAKWLFHVSLEQIQVLVHPQSVIHSAVEFADGAVIAQMGTPDMRLPIQYALLYPERRTIPGEKLDFYKLAQMTFSEADETTFRGLYLAKEALKRGGNVPTIFNAANEKAVSLFLKEKISFLQITEYIEECMNEIKEIKNPNVEEILFTQQMTEDFIESRYCS
ncbi:1-deoxy-D-xylulose 5-phosphate reductoisomerase [Lachnospiraceae bacterium XBB1006]|nr:1-deoxy-D-xylulose 5-phosphate reductoisomerase [Lachnospiraceae bacterium XBB1006]